MRNKYGLLSLFGYALLILALSVFQSTLGPRVGFFGCTPAIMLTLTAAAGFFDGEETGMLIGLASGFLLDALGGVGVSVLPLAYTLVGWFVAMMSRRMGHDRSNALFDRFLHYLIWLCVAVGLGMVITALCLGLTAGRVNIIAATLQILLPEALGSFVWGLPVGFIYLLFRLNGDHYERK